MDEIQSRFIETFSLFRKLNISAILPDISHGDFVTLKVIELSNRGGNSVTVSLLAERMHVASTAVSRTLRFLEEKNYVIRRIDKKDRRNTYVELTDMGREKLSIAEAIMNDFAIAVFDKVGMEHIEQFINYMRRLYEVGNEEIELRKYKDRKEESN